MTIEVRTAHKGDVHELSRTLGQAFYDDPLMKWMLPDAKARRIRLAPLFATMARHHYLGGGGVDVAISQRAVGAAALWAPPGHWRESRREELRMMPGLLRAFRSRIPVAQQVFELVKRHHPEEPHWYLAVIGSDPAVRGAGFGQVLMRSRLDRCDAEHAPAYLESTNRDNVPYYERFGFEVTNEIELPNGGPTLWAMWRRPRI